MSDLRRAAANLSEASRALSAAAQAMAAAASSLSASTQSLALPPRRSLPMPLPSVSTQAKAARSPNNSLPGTTQSQNTSTAAIAPDISSPKGLNTTPASTSPVPPALPTPTSTEHPATSPADDTVSLPTDPQIGSHPSSQPRYHILLNNESDVLPAAACLARKFSVIACYLPVTSLVSLPLYQQLFSQVLDCPVSTVRTTTVSTKAQADVDEFFNSHACGVLLLPESLTPQIDVNPLLDSCLIRIGWPSRRGNYEAQCTKHNMRHSVLVAFAEDVEMYSSGPDILAQSREWPESLGILSKDIPSARPRFRKALSDIPLPTKERIYPEWISDHGPRGRRHVESWPATTLVYRANLYLLDVLGYQPEQSLNEAEIRLPHVTAGFVAHNQLEAAVEDGVLNTNTPQASLQDRILSEAIPLNDSTPIRKPPNPNPTSSEPSRTYIVLDSDFDLYPFLFDLASSETVGSKVVCFAKEVTVVGYLVDQIKETVKLPVFVAVAQATAKLQQVAEEFHSVDRGILFWGAYTEPHPSLLAGKVDHVVHMGWTNDSELRNRQSDISKISTVVLARSEYSSMEQGRKILQSAGFSGSQKATPLNKRGEGSQLNEFRARWRSCLAATPVRALKNCYTHWMMHHFAGKYKVKEWTPIDLVKAGNYFARHVLLRGTNNDGLLEPPVGGQLSVTSGLVNHLGLQSAEQAGLLIVDS